MAKKWPVFDNFFYTKKRLKKAQNERKLLKTSFFINLRLFRTFFGRKNKCQKMGKSKANPLQKWQKNGHFSTIFFTKKNVSKRLKMKGNRLKRCFLLI